MSAFVDSLSVGDEFLDHSSQPGRKKESNRSQYAHQYKHPEEYPVNDHCHVLPVLLYLQRGDTEERDISNFTPHHLSFLPAVTFHPWLISLEWLIFPLWSSYLLKCQSILACLSYEKFKVKLQRSHCFTDRPLLARDGKCVLTMAGVRRSNNFHH